MRVMIDLFSGLGGASEFMKNRPEWSVIRIDNNPELEPDIFCDIKEYHHPSKQSVTLIWASPPCEEFTRTSLPWLKGPSPDMSLLEHTIRIISEVKPSYWVIENVSGAVRWFTPYLGHYRQRVGPVFLWGEFPIMNPVHIYWKAKLSGKNKDQRALIPRHISKALCLAIEAWDTNV